MNASILNQHIITSRPLQIILCGCFFIALVALLAAGIHSVMADNTVGMDVHTVYLAARNVFLRHQNPYGDDVAMQSQLSVLHHLASEQEDQMGFAYPPYAMLMVGPIASLPFEWVQAVWMSFLILGSAVVMLLAFTHRAFLPVIGVLLFYPFTFGIILGNLVIPIAIVFLYAISQIFLTNKPSTQIQIVLGFLLAWTTVKPQFSWLFLACLLLACVKQKLRPLITSFFPSMAFLFGVSFILVPGWPLLWLERIHKYSQYVSSDPTIAVYLAQLRTLPEVKTFSVALISLLLGVTAWAFVTWWRGRLSSLILLAWVGFVTYAVYPGNFAYAQIAFLIPLLIWAQAQKKIFSMPVILFFWTAIILSWLFVFFGKRGETSPLVEEWRLVIYCVWVFWLLIWPSARQIQPVVPSMPV